ncbi:alpha/beta-hydrolase [Coprinellus micaceus]|uniref:Alpha/beta-hydrolase n=1 Tax=Coprinellus micaceus TaxID=71717 RepID=A0A4Y7TUZ6_COPMI|nr:alpha/beta-hydrolase [Coprinellus micaceus]
MRFLETARSVGTATLAVIGSLLPNFKDTTVSRGLNYHYYFSPPASGKPTLLLVHGFPSLAVDWHPQINYFKQKGYGLVVPDQLGYGGTDKPKESKAYVHSRLAQDLVDIIDHENVTDVIAIGHDWGARTVSFLANLHSDRFLGFGFLAVGYVAPNSIGDAIEELRNSSIANIGYETFGYWSVVRLISPHPILIEWFYREFFSAPDAPKVIANHLEAFFNELYAKDGRLWRFNMGPTGAIRVWIESDTSTPRITSYADDQWKFHEQIFRKYTLDGPLNFYRVNLNGDQKEDDKLVPLENYEIKKPVFFGGAREDYVVVYWAQEASTRQFCPNLTVVNFDENHWVPSQAPKEVNQALEKWITGVVLA